MEKISLSIKQSINLVSMLKELFPEYDRIIVDLNNTVFLYPNIAKTPKLKNLSFHWFELCFTHLIEILETKLPFIGTELAYYDKLMSHVHHGGHPVDFLYEQFKKIK